MWLCSPLIYYTIFQKKQLTIDNREFSINSKKPLILENFQSTRKIDGNQKKRLTIGISLEKPLILGNFQWTWKTVGNQKKQLTIGNSQEKTVDFRKFSVNFRNSWKSEETVDYREFSWQKNLVFRKLSVNSKNSWKISVKLIKSINEKIKRWQTEMKCPIKRHKKHSRQNPQISDYHLSFLQTCW